MALKGKVTRRYTEEILEALGYGAATFDTPPPAGALLRGQFTRDCGTAETTNVSGEPLIFPEFAPCAPWKRYSCRLYLDSIEHYLGDETKNWTSGGGYESTYGDCSSVWSSLFSRLELQESNSYHSATPTVINETTPDEGQDLLTWTTKRTTPILYTSTATLTATAKVKITCYAGLKVSCVSHEHRMQFWAGVFVYGGRPVPRYYVPAIEVTERTYTEDGELQETTVNTYKFSVEGIEYAIGTDQNGDAVKMKILSATPNTSAAVEDMVFTFPYALHSGDADRTTKNYLSSVYNQATNERTGIVSVNFNVIIYS